MKIVKVYELTVKHKSIPEFSSYIDIHTCNKPPAFVYNNGDRSVLECDIDSVRLEVQRFSEYTLPPYMNTTRNSEPKVHDTYIALDEELEKLLCTKYSAKILKLETQLNKCADKLEGSLVKCANYEDLLLKFNKQPWYKRVYKSLWGL